MLRLIFTTLLAIILAFSGTSFGVLVLHELLIPPKPDSWGAAGVMLILAVVCGVVSAIISGIATFSVGTQFTRDITRWDSLGWLLGLVVGLALFPLISTRCYFPIRCLIGAIIVSGLMLSLPHVIRLLFLRKSDRDSLAE